MTNMDEQFLTPVEVAEMLQLKKNTVYDMIKRGDLKATKMGKQFRIKLEDVYEYMGVDKIPDEGNKIVICGQDPILDVLCAHFNNSGMKGVKAFRMALGSYNGLYEMYQNPGYVATSHLWDGSTDTYNIPYVTRMLPGEQIAIYHLVYRVQGLYVHRDNPKNITSFNDLLRDDVTIVNRERGSGIRVYVDEMMKNRNINPAKVKGYDNIATSHMQAAAMIARGNGDVSFGSLQASKNVDDVDFIPMKKESYDMTFRLADLTKKPYEQLVEIIQSDRFREEVEAMSGYDVANMGKRVY